MNKKIIIAIITVCSFLVVGGIIFWAATKVPPQTTEPINDTQNFFPGGSKDPVLPTPTQQTGASLTFRTKNNESVVMNDFYKNPQTRLLDEKKDAVLKEDRNYYIDYVAAEQSFGISLTGTNLQTSRDAGEQDLLKILGITRDDACKLNVSVTVPGSVNEDAAGVDYHLSFCPDGISLP